MTRDELDRYLSDDFDGDRAELERGLAGDPAARAQLAEAARFELLLREAARAATFCPACNDLVRGDHGDGRCDGCGAAARPGGYRVERLLVGNAHGRMYVARDADGKQVALKELAFVQSPSPAAVDAFERETRFLRALEHPAIPRFRASFEEGSGVHTRYYLAQDLVDGVSLDARLADHWYSEAEILDVARQVLAVLVYLQSLSPMVIHRDIKPANLLRRADGTIAVVDFGAAHVQGTTAGSTTIGTFGYMPIEQLAGLVDATTDGYALGATLIHLLTRQEPWRLLQARSFDAINVSAATRAFLEKLVAPEPRARFASARAALAALDALGSGTEPVAVAVQQPRRRRWRAAVGSVIGWQLAVVVSVAAIGAGAAVAGLHHASERREQERDRRAALHYLDDLTLDDFTLPVLPPGAATRLDQPPDSTLRRGLGGGISMRHGPGFGTLREMMTHGAAMRLSNIRRSPSSSIVLAVDSQLTLDEVFPTISLYLGAGVGPEITLVARADSDLVGVPVTFRDQRTPGRGLAITLESSTITVWSESAPDGPHRLLTISDARPDRLTAALTALVDRARSHDVRRSDERTITLRGTSNVRVQELVAAIAAARGNHELPLFTSVEVSLELPDAPQLRGLGSRPRASAGASAGAGAGAAAAAGASAGSAPSAPAPASP